MPFTMEVKIEIEEYLENNGNEKRMNSICIYPYQIHI